MKWKEASKIIKKRWEEELDIGEGGYYKEHIEKVLAKKELFLKSVEKFGTPQYILDEDVLKEKALGFKNTFGKYIFLILSSFMPLNQTIFHIPLNF